LPVREAHLDIAKFIVLSDNSIAHINEVTLRRHSLGDRSRVYHLPT